MVESNSDWSTLTQLVIKIIANSKRLKDHYTAETNAPVSYCAIFCRTNEEFNKFTNAAFKHGRLAKDTYTGPVYVVTPISTAAGTLRVVKIRKPDQTRLERGDTDFVARDFKKLKFQYLGSKGFKLIKRSNFEMVELMDQEFDSRVYFSNPPVEEHEGVRELLNK